MRLFRGIRTGGLACIIAVLSCGCECIQDYLDRDKPEPRTALTHSAETPKSFSRKEAVSLICSRLVILFSSLPEKPSLSFHESDGMTRSLASQLRQTNMIDIYNTESGKNRHIFQLASIPSKPNTWHIRVTDCRTGKVILDETLILTKNG